jgi:Holliday junction DNA helicase RuvB
VNEVTIIEDGRVMSLDVPGLDTDPDEIRAWLNGKVAEATAWSEEAMANVYAQEPPAVVDELSPRTWDDYIGQDDMKTHLRVRVGSAVARDDLLPHVLLYGPPGAGKSTIARIIASELGRRVQEVKRPLEAPALLDRVYRLQGGGVLFVDEIHLWGTSGQHQLMSLMEDQALDGPRGRVRFEKVTVVAATTERQRLGRPLVDRFMIRPRFEPYTLDQMAAIVDGMAARAAVTLSPDTATVLARAAAGVPRNARSLVLAARDLAFAGVDPTGAQVLAFTGVEPDGLTSDHLDYLEALASQAKGTAGEPTLSTLLAIDRGQVRDLERLLTAGRYVDLTGSGRQITQAGRARLAASRPTKET